MIREYLTPDFDVTVYEIEDVITVSFTEGSINGGAESDWWD